MVDMQLLEGSESRFALIGGAFSLSSDSRYLFSSNYDPTQHPVVEGESIRHGFIYDLQHMQKRHIAWSDDAADFVKNHGVLEESGCWWNGRLFVTTFTPKAIFVDVGRRPLTWQTTDKKPCQRSEMITPTDINLIWSQDGSVTLSHLPSGRLLASYKPRAILGSKVLINELQMSANGKWLTYSVTRPRGSFTGNSAGYLIDLNQAQVNPRLLARSVGTLRFSHDSKFLYGHLQSSEESGQRMAIVRWTL